MRILHIAVENFQDVAGLLSRSHTFFGDEGILITMVPSKLGFPNGILLNYPLLDSNIIKLFRKITGRENVNVLETELRLKIKGQHNLSKIFLKSRDIVWLYKLHKAWDRFQLGDFDIYHFDGDIPFIYGEQILKKLRKAKKHIVTHFFGSDLRKWGMNPYLREYAQLRFTSEVDHPKIDPALIFVPIPFETDKISRRLQENRILRIGHSPTRRTAKGTEDILKTVEKLKNKVKFEFLLIEGVSHMRCMELKATCDVGIDQIGNYAGTAYGRSGLEFLALGIPTVTEIPDKYEQLLPGHPFIKTTKESLYDVLYEVLTNASLRKEKKEQGLSWVKDFPNPKRIMEKIYKEYHRLGWV